MRTLPELLNRYDPDPDTRDILLSATEYSVQADRANRALVLNVSFPAVVRKRTLYRIEDEITQAYGLHTQQPNINTSSRMNDKPDTNRNSKKIIKSLFVNNFFK